MGRLRDSDKTPSDAETKRLLEECGAAAFEADLEAALEDAPIVSEGKIERISKALARRFSTLFKRPSKRGAGEAKLTASPPGGLAKEVLAFIYPAKVFEEIFAQAIADMREEYFDALAENAALKARWIIIRDHAGLLRAMIAHLRGARRKSSSTSGN